MKMLLCILISFLSPAALLSQSKAEKNIAWFLNENEYVKPQKEKETFEVQFVGSYKKKFKNRTKTIAANTHSGSVDIKFMFDRKGNFVRAESISKVKAKDEKMPELRPGPPVDAAERIIKVTHVIREVQFDKIWSTIDNYIPIANAEEFQLFVAEVKPDRINTGKVFILEAWEFTETLFWSPGFSSMGKKNRIRIYISMGGQILGSNNML